MDLLQESDIVSMALNSMPVVVAAQTKSDKHNLTGNDEKSVNGIIFILY